MRNPISHPPRSLILCLLILCAPAVRAAAQTQVGADVLSGRVTDLSGKPVAGAQVTTTASGGIVRTTTTGQDGEYRLYFPEVSPQYQVLVKRMGFAPVQRTIVRRTAGAEHMIVDLELGGTPLALSMVEITGSGDAPFQPSRATERNAAESTVPNPVREILALRDTLHLSAVEILALTDVADTLQSRNTGIYRDIRTLLAKSAAAGDAGQMSGSIALMLEDASRNTSRAVEEAKKLLRPEQWLILPPVIRDQAPPSTAGASNP